MLKRLLLGVPLSFKNGAFIQFSINPTQLELLVFSFFGVLLEFFQVDFSKKPDYALYSNNHGQPVPLLSSKSNSLCKRFLPNKCQVCPFMQKYQNRKSSFAKSYLGEEDMVTIPWMPTAVHRNSVFLGRREQVEDIQVLNKLSITHVLSIGR